jgi:hypothetical protein
MAGDPANEVCSTDTRTNVANQLTVGHISGVPAMTKAGTNTTCTYQLSNGSMRMIVDELASNAAAEARFDALRRQPGKHTAVPNLGTAAFTGPDGTTVTIKDNKVLTVDTASLPPGNDKTQISQSLSFEILSCWTG